MRNSLAEETFEDISRCIFRVATSWQRHDGQACSSSATAFTVAVAKNSRRLILATAAHVVEFPVGTEIQWCIQQFDVGGNIVKECRYNTTDPDDRFGMNKKYDVAWVAPPTVGNDGIRLACDSESPVSMVNPELGVTAGTRVGWAGFPGQVETYLKRPQLCYFEGTVSAMVVQPRPRYLVDGHNARGVSGGPVWHWSTERNRAEVFGIVSGYGLGEADMPGFCVFEPINPLVCLFERWIAEGKWNRA